MTTQSPPKPSQASTERDPATRPINRLITAILKTRFFAVLLLLIALFIYFSLTQGAFFTSSNLDVLLTSSAILFIVSIGLTFVMLSGGFDLSIGPMLALTGITLGKLSASGSLPLVVGIALTLLAGCALGGLNGVLIGKLGLPFLVITLGTYSLYTGILDLWSNALTQQITSPTLTAVAFNHVAGIPIPALMMAGIFIIALFALRRTFFGRDVYAVGGNADAARLSGIRVSRTLVVVYAISGLLAAVAGILQVSQVGAASPNVGATIIFNAAAAVLLGGTSFAGGIGGVGGTLVGVMFLGVLQNGLSNAGISSYWQEVVTGGILIVVIGLDRLRNSGWSLSVALRPLRERKLR